MNTIDRQTKIKQLMPRLDIYGHHGYSMNDVEKFKEIIKLIKNEPNRQLQTKYFTIIMDKVKYFMRNFNFDRKKPATKTESTEICSMLRNLKKLHFDIDYKPGHMSLINDYIRDLGGTVMTVEQMREQKRAKLEAAAEKIKNGEKMPRRKKKSILGMLRQGNQK